MADDRLAAKVEVSGFLRRAEAVGGSGMVLKRGDPDRGAILLLVAERGVHIACLERLLRPSGRYAWETTGPETSADAQKVADFAAGRARFDTDLWLIELDIPGAQRFVAETTFEG